MHRRAAFTLVELSIVLVIIGLIVGGVLVGQDLVKGAEVRKVISDIEKYKTATMAFKGKYGGLPGDLKGAAGYGMPSASWRVSTWAKSDGNGLLESYYGFAGTSSQILLGGETFWFWKDLQWTNLIASNIDITSNAYYAVNMDTETKREQALPHIGKLFVMVYARGTSHFFELAGPTTTDAMGTFGQPWDAIPFEYRLTVSDVLQIEAKLDDGNPRTGTIRAVQAGYLGTLPTPAANACTVSATAYNLSSSYINQPLCALEFAAGF